MKFSVRPEHRTQRSVHAAFDLMTYTEAEQVANRDQAGRPAPLVTGGITSARRRRAMWWTLVLVLGGLLVARALELRIPQMTRPLWEDEVHHNESLLSSADMKALLQHSQFLYQYQPVFDFWTRKVFWFPLLGVNERAMRMPALVYGVALVLLVYALALVSFASRVNRWWAALLSFCAALWIVNNPVQIHYSAEARHYTLVAFASALWCVLLFLLDGRPRLLFAFATLLFANTHFFSLPMIAGGYLLLIAAEARSRNHRWIPFHLLVLFGVFACTRWINGGPLQYLMERPPQAATSRHLINALSLPALKSALDIWFDYGTFLALPVTAWVFWVVMLAVVVVRREWRWVPFFAAVFVALPAFFLYVRVQSEYPFRVPYFSPFIGLGLVSLLALLGFAVDGWKWLARRLPPAPRAVGAAVGTAAVAVALGVPAFSRGLVADRGGIHRLERNFSPYFLAYGELAREGKPVFVLHNHCWADDIPNLYFAHILPVKGIFFTTADSMNCRHPIPVARERLSDFLRDYGPRGGFVVLDQKEDSCQNRPVPSVEFPGNVERVSAVDVCMWKVRGARSLQDLALVAAAVGFRTAPDFF